MRRSCYIFILIFTIVILSCSQSNVPKDSNRIEQQILTVLNNQVEGWNDCDIVKYMQGYWNSDSLRFSSGGRIQYGWKETMDGYQKRYPDKAAIGHLTFSEIDIDVLSSDAALVFGRWTLKRDKDTPTGLFTLVFRKTDHGWRIVSDHTSSAGSN
jgi:ketosteroid isomerase-like protein